jgi:hypothetical protein
MRCLTQLPNDKKPAIPAPAILLNREDYHTTNDPQPTIPYINAAAIERTELFDARLRASAIRFPRSLRSSARCS